jgi:hypothetical protein
MSTVKYKISYFSFGKLDKIKPHDKQPWLSKILHAAVINYVPRHLLNKS